MEIATPLGEGVLLFHRMQAREEMSRLSEFRLELLSTRGDIDVDEILGKPVTVTLTQDDDSPRYFTGSVVGFSQEGMLGRYHLYSAEVRPWLWFLTRTADCRIFQEMTVPDILKAVFADHAVSDCTFELMERYRTWTYCVQYRETDFNFVSRLMEEEGIYYYFRHTKDHNTLVLTDSLASHTPAPGYEEMPLYLPGQLVRPEVEHLHRWRFQRTIQPGAYVHTDYDHTRPATPLETRRILPRTYTPSDYEVFDYPGHYMQKTDGEQYAHVRIDEYGSQFETCEGAGNVRGVCVGSVFTLKGCAREDQNRAHLVLQTQYELLFGNYEGLPEQEGAHVHVALTAMDHQQQFRPQRRTPKPFVQGPQTAEVVGPAGEELYTDK
jgi:type VI secretion system secreted protein VgrG